MEFCELKLVLLQNLSLEPNLSKKSFRITTLYFSTAGVKMYSFYEIALPEEVLRPLGYFHGSITKYLLGTIRPWHYLPRFPFTGDSTGLFSTKSQRQ